MNTISKTGKCKVCTKIDTKEGRIREEQDRINRWVKEEQRGHQKGTSVEEAEDNIATLYREIGELKLQQTRDASFKDRLSPVVTPNFITATGGIDIEELMKHVTGNRELRKGGKDRKKSSPGRRVSPDGFRSHKAEVSISPTTEKTEDTVPPITTPFSGKWEKYVTIKWKCVSPHRSSRHHLLNNGTDLWKYF